MDFEQLNQLRFGSSQSNDIKYESVLKHSHGDGIDSYQVDDTIFKLKQISPDIDCTNTSTHSSFVSPSSPFPKSDTEHDTPDLFVEDLGNEEDNEVESVCRSKQVFCYAKTQKIKEDVIIVSKIQPALSSQQSAQSSTGNGRSLTRCTADSDKMNHQRSAAPEEVSASNIPVFETIIFQKRKQAQQHCVSPSSSSSLSTITSQVDENKNNILLEKAPTTKYVSLETATKQQDQCDLDSRRLQQVVPDYHHHQQHDQRKVLTKLFLPNKIHVKPIHRVQQEQLKLSVVSDGQKHQQNLIFKNNGYKTKVLSFRKCFVSPTKSH